MSVIVDGTAGLTFNDASTQNTAATGFGFKNRIINGDMRIDQRNNGASISFPAGDGNYCLDRWRLQRQGAGTMTVQQVTSAPTGFTNAIRFTVTGASTPSPTDFYTFGQLIEGFNTADLAWGTASAQNVTLSFWINSSVTGTYSASVYNWAGTNAYPATFTVNASNTWEYKTITIPGATAGTWATNNTGSVYFRIDLGSGSNFNGTPNAWNTSGQIRTSSSVNFISNASATLSVTGVQFEKSSTATSFDFRNYGIELGLCYRYYRRYGPGNNQMLGAGYATSSTAIWRWGFSLDIPMRVAPTVLLNTCQAWAGSSLGSPASVSTSYTATNFVDLDITTSGMGVAVVGGIAKMYLAGASPFIELSGAEL